jgi:hypothetical protein
MRLIIADEAKQARARSSEKVIFRHGYEKNLAGLLRAQCRDSCFAGLEVWHFHSNLDGAPCHQQARAEQIGFAFLEAKRRVQDVVGSAGRRWVNGISIDRHSWSSTWLANHVSKQTCRERREGAHKIQEYFAVLDVPEGVSVPPETEPGLRSLVITRLKTGERCWLDGREDDRHFR